jgi:hypothetical protein
MSADESVAARAALRAAWDEMLADLSRARDAIDQPARMPAPPTDRNLAEGYRYLMGYLHGAVERAFFEDPHFPFVRSVLQLVNKATIDNADAIYFAAPIDGRECYMLRGRAADHRHWRGEAPAATGRIAPQYLIFEVSAGELAGDSGSLAELRPGVKAQTGRLDSTAIEVDDDGRFEILLAPQRPSGYRGNFIATHRRTRRPNPDDSEGSLDRHANYLSGRQLFGDWEREDAVLLTIERVASAASRPAPLDSATAAAQLRRFRKLIANQMGFWNEFYTVLLETYGKPDGSEGERFMPRNAFNAPNAASSATGGGQSTNLYAGGVYELEPDEALVIESEIPIPPQYIGFHLSNLWGESHDFANHQSSLNGFQAEFDDDGRLRWVVAHRDPGIPNWVDTTGHREGFMAPRWAYTEAPPRDRWPTISATKVRFDEIRDHLPANVRTVAPGERAERIRIRREHVQRRYRAF